MEVEEALLVYKDGRLIGHKAAENKTPTHEIEVKVKSVVKKHFEEKKELKSTVVSHEHYYVMFQKGTDAYLVAIAPGTQTLSLGAVRTPVAMIRAMDAFEKENKEALKDWDGHKGSLKNVDETLDELL